MNTKTALLAMGYRQLNNIWFKPVGFNLFVYKESENEFFNYFLNAKSKLSIWNSVQIKENSDLNKFIYELKEAECYSTLANSPSDFQFITLEEELELNL